MYYTVTNIVEADFGCEERPEGRGAQACVYLKDETGAGRVLEQDEVWLADAGIKEGACVRIDDRGRLVKEPLKIVRVVAAVICDNMDKKTKIFATQRGYGAMKGGWEFPGGKVEPGETPEQALVREIEEELDTEIEIGDLVDAVDYDYPDFHLSMVCFWCTVKSGNLVLREHQAARWLTRDTIHSVGWLPADTGLVEKIASKMGRRTE